MIITSIIASMDGNFPVWERRTGFAKTLAIAQWIFEYTGWKTDQPCPDLCYKVDEIEWEEGDKYFPPSDQLELYVLGMPLRMN